MPANQGTGVSTAVRKTVRVKTIAGHDIELLHQREKRFYEEARDKYLSENKFTASSDLRALDRLLLFETQVYRWQWQLACGADYDMVELENSDMADLRRSIKDTESLISTLQNDLTLTKNQRDKSNNAESVGAYIENLRRRALEHGYHRDKQVGKAIELINELIAITGSFKRANEEERRKLGFEKADDIVDWVLEVLQPQYDAVDQWYRSNNQRYWVKDL